MGRLAALLILAALAGGPARGADGDADRPNILLILADDFGWGDASCNNPDSAFRTPNIDRIAREGIRFTNAHTPHSVCSPTRYALLTGRYAWRTWMREGVLAGYGRALIGPRRLTLASLLKECGYATGAFGKWHVGMDWQPVEGDPGDWHWGTQVRGRGVIGRLSRRVDHSRPVRNGPTGIGFDTCFVTPSNNTRIPVFVRDDRVDGNPRRDKNGLMRDPRVRRDTVDDLFVDEAIGFLDRHLSEKGDRPFFIYLPLNAAHGATKPPADLKGKSGDGERGDKCLWVDRSVGRMLEALDGKKLTRSTLVIFTADNGPISPHRYKPDTKHRAAGPYRGYKTDAWDGGFRVPFVVRWPERVPAGATYGGLFCLTDVLSTLAALLGKELPRWAGEDGFSHLPGLLGRDGTPAPRDEVITQSYVGVLSVRKGRWKLILDTKGSGGHERATPGFEPLVMGPPWEILASRTGQLYDIEADPYERNDLFEKHPEEVAELKRLLQKRISDGRSRP